MTTVLPNPRPHCYARSFAPVPSGGCVGAGRAGGALSAGGRRTLAACRAAGAGPRLPLLLLPLLLGRAGACRVLPHHRSDPIHAACTPGTTWHRLPDWREFVRYGLSAKRGSGCNDLVRCLLRPAVPCPPRPVLVACFRRAAPPSLAAALPAPPLGRRNHALDAAARAPLPFPALQVISGHGVVYTAVPLALQTYYPLPLWRGGAAAVAWAAVLRLCLEVRAACGGCGQCGGHPAPTGWTSKEGGPAACCGRTSSPASLALPRTHRPQETVAKTHYSVDMLLAVVTTALVWHWRGASYPAAATVPRRAPGAPPDPKPWRLVALVFGVLVVVFVGVAGT